MKAYSGWLIAGVLLAAMIYLQICNTPKIVKVDTQYNALKKQTEDTIAYYEIMLKANDAATELAIAQAETAFQKQLQAEANLKSSSDKVSTLTDQLRSARIGMKEPHGEIDKWVPVSPLYINSCDSLEVAADRLTVRANGVIKANDSLREKINTANESYKTSLADKDRFNTALRSQLAACEVSLKNKTESKKRSQVYAGVNLMGNKTYFIDGGQVNLTLLTKRNTMFEANAGLIHGQMYYGAGTKLLISLRRK